MTAVSNHIKEELGKPYKTVTGWIMPEDFYERPGIEVAGRGGECVSGVMRGAYSVVERTKGFLDGSRGGRSGEEECNKGRLRTLIYEKVERKNRSSHLETCSKPARI